MDAMQVLLHHPCTLIHCMPLTHMLAAGRAALLCFMRRGLCKGAFRPEYNVAPGLVQVRCLICLVQMREYIPQGRCSSLQLAYILTSSLQLAVWHLGESPFIASVIADVVRHTTAQTIAEPLWAVEVRAVAALLRKAYILTWGRH